MHGEVIVEACGWTDVDFVPCVLERGHGGMHLFKKVCSAGHLLTEKTMYVTPKGYRHCRRCLSLADARYRAKKRAS